MYKPFKLIHLISIPFLFLLFAACQREVKEPNPNNPTSPTTIDDNIMVTAGVRGIVVDENNKPIAGATVKSGTNTTTTDRYGVFRFNNISLSKENGHVQVEKSGFFTGHRTFPSTAGRTHNVRLKLLTKNNTGNFVATAGGTITLASGGKLVIPANAVTDAGGVAYTGQVNIAMTWIDPSAADLPDRVMGDLRGITTSGEERGLQTFGMLGVEMTSPSGQTLKIANGKTAELTFPVPASMVSNAPATIDLWHYDEAKGRWKQEGTATKTGANYVAQVSHFSFWNCDAPFPLVNLCMTVVNSTNNSPIINGAVRIRRNPATLGWATGYTDSSGNLCGKVPKNEALVLEVLDQCYNTVYSQNIGPFSTNASLDTVRVAIPASNTLTITGTLQNCAAVNVTNGAVAIYIADGYSYNIPVTNGAFSHTLLRCNANPVNFSVLGVDYTTLQQSVLVGGSGTSGTVSVGTFQACGTSAAEFMELLVDGNPITFVSPPDQISVFDSTSTGPYTLRSNVYATRQNSGTTGLVSFTFSNNEAVATGLPLSDVFINLSNTNSSSQVVTASPVLTTTAFGPLVTGFIEGNFTVQMNFAGTIRTVTCNFKVRRG